MRADFALVLAAAISAATMARAQCPAPAAERAGLDDARRSAMADALRQARVYADAGDLRLDGIDHIVDGQAASRGDGAFDLPARLARTASVGIVAPKALAFSGSVTVTCHIAPR